MLETVLLPFPELTEELFLWLNGFSSASVT